MIHYYYNIKDYNKNITFFKNNILHKKQIIKILKMKCQNKLMLIRKKVSLINIRKN